MGNLKHVNEMIGGEEVKSKELLRLDIACGNNKRPGFIGLDISRTGTQADHVCDLFSPVWLMDSETIKESSVGEIFCSHFIEHVPDLMLFTNELHRIMAPGAIATFHAPYYSSVRAMQDPTHKQHISENTFLYWIRSWRESNGLGHYPIVCDFQVSSIKYEYNADWINRAEPAKEWARRHYLNVVDNIEVIVRCIK